MVFYLGTLQRIIGLECIAFLEHIRSAFLPASEFAREQVSETLSFLHELLERLETIDRDNPS